MNKKEKKVLRFLKTNILTSVAIFLVIFCVVVFAGDVIVKEGAMDVSEDLNVSGAGTFEGTVMVNDANVKGKYLILNGVGGGGPGEDTYGGGIAWYSAADTPYMYTFTNEAGDFAVSTAPQSSVSDRGNGRITANGNFESNYGGVYVGGVIQAAALKFQVASTGETWIKSDSVGTKYGYGGDAKIYWDNVNLIFKTNLTTPFTGIAWFSEDVSADDYITRTSVYDKSQGSALSFIKDADDYKTDSEIDHTKFYGYVSYDVTDMSRPEFNETSNETYYPYKIKEQGVSLNSEIDVLRQAVYELKLQNQDLLNRIEVLEGK